MRTFREIDAARERAGITPKQLYERAGLHHKTWYRLVSDPSGTRVRTLERLEQALNQLTEARRCGR